MGGVSRASIIFLRKWNPFCSSSKESIATMRWPTNVQSDDDSKETQKIILCVTKDARGRTTNVALLRSEATQMIKKQALEFHTRSTTPQSVQACRRKNAPPSFTVDKKHLKMCHTFFSLLWTAIQIEFWQEFGGPESSEFFLNFFPLCKKHTPDALQEWKKLCTLCEWEGFLKTLYISFYNLGTWQFAFIRAHRTIDVQSENKEPIKVKYLVVQVVNSGKSLITVVTHL